MSEMLSEKEVEEISNDIKSVFVKHKCDPTNTYAMLCYMLDDLEDFLEVPKEKSQLVQRKEEA